MAIDLNAIRARSSQAPTSEDTVDEENGPFYVWTPMRVVGDNGKTTNLKVGTEVTAADLGIDEEEFRAYLDSGAVRTAQYPVSEEEAFTLPPATFYQREVARASGNLEEPTA